MCAALVAVPLLGVDVARVAGPDPTGTIYVSDGTAKAIDVFAPGSSGDVAPERVISGNDTQLRGPGDVKVDAAGDIWVANTSYPCSVLTCHFSITEYAPGATGDVAPICTIPLANEPDDFSLEPDGTLYVGYLTAGSVDVYGADTCDHAPAVRTISGIGDRLDGVGVDAAGTLYADDTNDNTIQVFSPGANGSAKPERSISGPSTNLSGPDDVVVGFGGALYASNGFDPTDTSSVEVFAPGASGDATPTQDIVGPSTQLSGADDLAVDATGNIYVTDSGRVLVFSANATGDVPPIATIAGPNTKFRRTRGRRGGGPTGGGIGHGHNRGIESCDTARRLHFRCGQGSRWNECADRVVGVRAVRARRQHVRECSRVHLARGSRERRRRV